jgi:hypothetical protein
VISADQRSFELLHRGKTDQVKKIKQPDPDDAENEMQPAQHD